GVQQFHCRRQRHASTSGQVLMLEPGEVHDGDAPNADGFTYRMLYLDPHWIGRELTSLFEDSPRGFQPGFASTLARDPQLAQSIVFAFSALAGQ
ncbi:AraC family ligand binding domain-containing protein, partial [Pseudomonas viridiflava]|uniref:AraC family ligand binding domain-containing protein n=1 Tax=Pseudomonas viridiflava TaxID=33069 RepID=UPI00197D9CCF